MLCVTGEYQSYVTDIAYTVPTPERGCLIKHTITDDPLDDDQIKFLTWAWKVGEENRKKKLSSRMAAVLMRMHGTVQGQNRYETRQHECCLSMNPNHDLHPIPQVP